MTRFEDALEFVPMNQLIVAVISLTWLQFWVCPDLVE